MRRAWPDILEGVKRKSRVAWATVMSGVQVNSLEGNVLTLSFEAEGNRKGFANGGRDAVVREVLREFLGVDWRIETVLGGASSPPRGAAQPAPSSAPPAPPPPRRPVQPPAEPGPAAASPTTSAGTALPVRPASTPQPAPQAYDEPPPPEVPPGYDESDEVDPEGDADADGTEAEASGMALIQRELGGKIIREIDSS